MRKEKRESELYRRGRFTLAWDRRSDGSLRSPYLATFWYDAERRRTRSLSTGTADLEAGKRWLDAHYLENETGQCVCPTCGQQVRSSGHLVTNAITNYQIHHGDQQSSAKAIAARLAHVIQYIAIKGNIRLTCEQVDETWIAGFRSWAEAQPVVGTNGKERDRSLSTVELSVVQLQAAINHAHKRRDTPNPARFKPVPIKQLNRTPQHRSDVAELARMFAYCVDPVVTKNELAGWGRRKAPYSVDEMRAIRVRERASLHRFLIISLASLARPDAAHDVSLKSSRRQWNGNARILALNPAGRRQTKKYRAIVPVAWQVALHLEAQREEVARAEAIEAKPRSAATPDAKKVRRFFVGPKSVRKAWDAMAADLSLPVDGEAGMKLIRRSVAHILRSRLPVEAWGEIEIFLGHDKFDDVSDLYAPFRPDYLRRALAEIESLIDEIETLVPGAFHRSGTGDRAAIIPLQMARKS